MTVVKRFLSPSSTLSGIGKQSVYARIIFMRALHSLRSPIMEDCGAGVWSQDHQKGKFEEVARALSLRSKHEPSNSSACGQASLWQDSATRRLMKSSEVRANSPGAEPSRGRGITTQFHFTQSAWTPSCDKFETGKDRAGMAEALVTNAWIN